MLRRCLSLAIVLAALPAADAFHAPGTRLASGLVGNELDTAKAALLEAVPGAVIRERQHGGQPIQVTISLLKEDELDPAYSLCLPASESWLMAPKAMVWTGSQRELFRKNADRRQQSIFDIQKAALRSLLPSTQGAVPPPVDPS
ncbi:hypothetical protein T484DRAFT_1908347 [Baffinella frigidus]|nr:hypothetical protein T484DRAFT_1908347 [Cryptophyta sp. CCMP2293]